MQNGFVDPEGPIPFRGAEEIIVPIADLVHAFRKKGMMIVWARMSLDGFQTGPYRELCPNRFKDDGANLLPAGSKWHELVQPLKDLVRPNDLIIDKDRYSAFYQTNLELRLRQAGIVNLVVCGIATNICVESTVRDAFQRDFYSYIVTDCTRSFSNELQAFAEKIIGMSFGFTLTKDDLIKHLSATV